MMRKLQTDELGRLSPEEFDQSQKLPVCLVLDNIRSGLNVGSAFRTADAFAFEHIHLCGISSRPPQREVLKSALGATRTVTWTYHEETEQAAMALRKEGWIVIGVEQTNKSMPLHALQLKPNGRYAFIFGNEIRGLSPDVLPLLHHAVEITQYGTKHSLNVAVCAGIVSWQVSRLLHS